MAIAKKVKAGKDYPHIGVKKGDVHWVWEHYGTKTQRSHIDYPPRPSQLMSGHWSEVLGLKEELERLIASKPSAEDAASFIEDTIDALEDVQGRYDDVQEGPKADAAAECSGTLGDLIDGLQDIHAELEGLDDGEQSDTTVKDWASKKERGAGALACRACEYEPEVGCEAVKCPKCGFNGVDNEEQRDAHGAEVALEQLNEALMLDWERPEA